MDDASEASPALCSQLNKTVPSHHFSSTVPVEWASADQPMPVTHTAEKLFESKAYFSTSLVGKVRGIFNHLVKTTDIYLGRNIYIASFLPQESNSVLLFFTSKEGMGLGGVACYLVCCSLPHYIRFGIICKYIKFFQGGRGVTGNEPNLSKNLLKINFHIVLLGDSLLPVTENK